MLCCIIILLLSIPAFAQQNISGTILSSDDGEPLIGATIYIKGTQRGIVTDIDGKYTLSAEPEDVLVISYVGYLAQEIKVGNRTDISLSLELNFEELGEVIVLGYSSTTQKELSASVVSIDAKDLQVVTSANVQNMLQGQAAGVTVSSSTGAPGAASDVRIRGLTSININQPPLYVVDGIIGGNYVPNDVETLTVLKDAAAIGLYGAAGAAGVIIITTKSGSGKPSLSFSSSYGVKDAIMGNFEMMNGQELYDAQRQMWGEANTVSFLNNRPEYLEDRNYDWLDAGFDRAIIQNYNLAASGGKDGIQYGLSVDFFSEEGTFIETNFDRLNINGNIGFDITDKLRVQSSVNVQWSNSTSNHYSWFEDSFWNMPWDNPTGDDGSLLGPEYVTNTNNEWYGQFRRSFLYSAESDQIKFMDNNSIWSTTLTYDLTDWLSLETRTRVSQYSNTSSEYYSPLTDFGLALNGTVSQSRFESQGISSTHFLRFSKTFGKHDFGGFVAHEGGVSRDTDLSFSGQNLSSLTVTVPSGASAGFNGSGNRDYDRGISFISEFTYGYNSKYFVTGYFRRDGSSRFAKNKQFGNFPGGSVAWLVSEEDFLSGVSFIDLLKLRLSYGSLGNSALPRYLSLPTYNITRQYNNQPGGEPDNPQNENLGWETTNILNAGLDFSLLNGLVMNVDVYNKVVTGMLLENPLPFSNGYENRWENIADMTNQGIELSLTYNRSFGEFNYSGNFNIAFNRNEITKISDAIDQQLQTSGSLLQINEEGSEAFVWYMPKWLGVDTETGEPIYEVLTPNPDGTMERSVTNVFSEASDQPIESALPTYSGGTRQSIGYKGITLSALFTFQGGNHIYHQTRAFVDTDGASTGINQMRLHDGWSRWEEPGDVATHPQLQRGGNNGAHQTSSRYVEKGDFIRLRNVSLSYNIPKNLLDYVGLKAATLSLRADNLATWTDFSGMDPEVGLNGGAFALPGVSSLKYPISRQFVVGLNVNL